MVVDDVRELIFVADPHSTPLTLVKKTLVAVDKKRCHTSDNINYRRNIKKLSVLTTRVVASYEWFEHSDAVRVLRLAHYDHLRVQSEQDCSFHYTQS